MNVLDGTRDPTESVDQSHNLASLKAEIRGSVGRRLRRSVNRRLRFVGRVRWRRGDVEARIFGRKENPERGSESGDLDFAPEPAFVAADAVHDSRDVPELFLELFLERDALHLVGEHGGFVEMAAVELVDRLEQTLHLFPDEVVLCFVAREILFVGDQVRRYFGQSAQFEEIKEIKVSQPSRAFAVGRNRVESTLELGRAGTPNAVHRVERRTWLEKRRRRRI